MGLFESVFSIDANREIIREKANGIIEINRGQFSSIRFRPWPKLVSIVEAHWADSWGKKRITHDQCLFYYSQPRNQSNFLTLKYVQSTLNTSAMTCIVGLSVLDHVAAIKGSDAIVCEITNRRISDRYMRRYGWERHLETSKRRHWIKRFYGNHPKSFFYQSRTETLDPVGSGAMNA